MSGWLAGKLRAFNSDQRGAALILVTIAIPTIFGMASFAVDLGYLYYVKTRLQTAVDLGVLAGGTLLPTGDADAIAARAKEYTELNLPASWRGKDNAVTVTTDAKALCSIKLETSSGLTCYGAPHSPNTVNYVSVSVDASVPLFFASALGMKAALVSADGVAAGGDATMPPFNVAIVLDTTLSMDDPSVYSGSGTKPTCVTKGLNKLECAKYSTMGMVGKLWPIVDKVALYTYPGMAKAASPAAAASNIAKNLCGTGNPKTGDYKLASGSDYKVVDFSEGYRDMKAPPTVAKNTADPLIQALDTTTCKGLRIGSKDGNTPTYSNIVYTFYADAIDQAQADLEKANQALIDAGNAPRQNVLVILSDGDSNAQAPAMIETARQPNQCLQSIQAAQRAAAAGTWVYSVANNASAVAGPGSGGSCRYDTSQVPSGQVTVTKVRTTTTYTMTYNNGTKKCGSWVKGTPQNGSPQVTQTAAPGPAPGTSAVTTTQPSGTCSKSRPTVTYTEYYDTTSVSPVTTTKYDRSACDTMRAMASSPDKFYSDDISVCDSINKTTDLTTIFNRLAISLMKKRRVPMRAIN